MLVTPNCKITSEVSIDSPRLRALAPEKMGHTAAGDAHGVLMVVAWIFLTEITEVIGLWASCKVSDGSLSCSGVLSAPHGYGRRIGMKLNDD